MSKTSGFFEHSKESEMSVLGSIMKDPSTLRLAGKYIVSHEDFYILSHRWIWHAIKILEKQDIKPELVLVTEKLQQLNKLGNENTVQPQYLVQLVENINSPTMIEEYAKTVKKYAIKRQIYNLSIEMSISCKKPFEECISDATKLTKEINRLRLTDDFSSNSVSNNIDKALEDINKGTNIIPFGLPFLDYSSNGVTRGGISVLGGRPGHGKTTLATNIAMSIAELGYRVEMINRQIPNEEIHKKMIVSESGILSYGKIRQGKYKYNMNKEKVLNLTKEDMERIEEATETIKRKYKNLIMVDNIRTMDDTVTSIKNIEPDFVIDDYVQLIKGNGKYEGRRFELEDNMMEYEWQSKPSNLNFAGLLLSQLSREIEKRMDQMPRISDFSEAGAIEQIAESAFFIFYGHNFDSEAYPKHQADIIFGKTRYGNLNSHKIGYNGDKCRYYMKVDDALADK